MDVNEYQDRRVEDVKKVLGFAKVDENELKCTVQCIGFMPEFDNEAIKLLEMDNDVAKELKEGQSVVIRGLKSDSAVLCTSNKTYEIKDTETSNSLLILQHCSLGEDMDSERVDFTIEHKQICALKHEYLELRPVKPRLQNMKHLLEETMYSGQEYEEDDQHQGSKYTMEDLRSMVQASDAEIMQGLVDLQACLINGYWRLLDFDFLAKVLSDVIVLQDEHGWSFDAVPGHICCDELKEIYSREVVIHILRCYSVLPEGEPLHVDISMAERQTYRINEDKLCRFFAELLLRPVDKFCLKDFLDTWQQAVPEGMSTGLYQLEGVALVERNSVPEVITYFPVNELPEDASERFNSLFKKKTKWSLEEITPYLRDLCTEKVAVSNLLMKYARASTQNGVKFYSSKKLIL